MGGLTQAVKAAVASSVAQVRTAAPAPLRSRRSIALAMAPMLARIIHETRWALATRDRE
jgi:hypothetical protein